MNAMGSFNSLMQKGKRGNWKGNTLYLRFRTFHTAFSICFGMRWIEKQGSLDLLTDLNWLIVAQEITMVHVYASKTLEGGFFNCTGDMLLTLETMNKQSESA